MKHSEEKVQEILEKITQDMEPRKKVCTVMWRDDYMDYVLVLDLTHHVEIREKLIDDYINHYHEDVLRELRFLLSHPVEYEDWEKEDLAGPPVDADEKTAIDDSDQYDF